MQRPRSDAELEAPGLLRLASRLAGAEDAEDLVQATYVRALEHRGAVRAPRPWLRQVLVNEGRMQLRSRLRRDAREAAPSVEPVEPVGAEDVVHCLEIAQIVGSLLDELDDDVRAVVRERYFDGETAASIARRHAIPAGTVRWRLKTGLDRMRSQLDARYGGRRALWAGGFVPATFGPTLGDGAASQAAVASPTAATKGLSAMSVKLLVGIGIVAATAGGVVALSGDADAERRDPQVQPTTEAELVAKVARTNADAVEPPTPSSDSSSPTAAKLAWQGRVSKIREHREHHTWIAAPEATEGEPTCGDEPCDGNSHASPALVQRLASEVLTLVESCRQEGTELPSGLSLTASVLGAPDVGTVVESVQLNANTDAPAELQECMTEAMYTLDLGEVDTDFEQEITVMIQSDLDELANLRDADPELLERVDLEALDPKVRAEVEA
ncbi:MAG: RNA polymerase sigma factor, partial [Myxococcota bacterium]